MTLSRKAVRPAQIRYLVSNGFLPISLDFRLCPEISIFDGPFTDVRDGYRWVREQLPSLYKNRGISLNVGQTVVLGWSTGGHLAMSLGWTTAEANIPPPAALLSFYAPVDFERDSRCPSLTTHQS